MYKCNKCSRTFYSKVGLEAHRSGYHPSSSEDSPSDDNLQNLINTEIQNSMNIDSSTPSTDFGGGDFSGGGSGGDY